MQQMPPKLEKLPELANNLWWSWNQEAREVWRRLDYPLWRSTTHNPVRMLHEISSEQLEKKANDPAFIRRLNKVLLNFEKAMSFEGSWFNTTYPQLTDKKIAYFSAEFGLHVSLPIYSGGLGILSGDHVKEAGDLGLPFVGVGFMYPQGYFRQRLPAHGWQEAVYQQLELDKSPVNIARDEQGNEIRISVKIGDSEVWARIWNVEVGRATLYLMDTDIEANDPWNREISARLYGGDTEMRIRQEIMLGIGGVRALRALGVQPDVWHMNEGHSAFLVLELVREIITQNGMSFHDAALQVRPHCIFTTHTPVPAGHDAFAFDLMDRYFWDYWEQVGLDREGFMNLGKHQEAWGEAFNMTVLALNMSGYANGVSQLHAEVSRNMWGSVWPEIADEKDIPIIGITNGIHVPTWIAMPMNNLFSRRLDPKWLVKHDDQALWELVDQIPDDELWQVHSELRYKLLSEIRERARRRWVQGNRDATEVITTGAFLDPDALTIGFARRFATYKRATLIFRDPDRLKRLLLNRDRPVQIIFAGKAHPADDPGKHMIQTIYNIAKSQEWGGRIAFLEDYDMHMGRYLKQGSDVWLNNPRRPREASGTSGMKAALNGVPNLSILDGWWVEGYNGANGWAIGSEHEYDNPEVQDASDAESLYQLLEQEIVPLYYDRDRDGIPRGWVQVMRESIRSNTAKFSMRRMVKEYAEQLYIPAMNGDE
ncbi:MAG: alpha-glucan family phosphorylase [Ardenticatenaceae bacterium]|nr:alpha-glucan family phosphorylase [Ardenticatenaceae bacterium]